MLIYQAAFIISSLLWPSLAQGPPPDKSYINATRNDNSSVQLQINSNGERNETAPHLYGWMIEDISHSIDGGLYAELIVNRAFQGSGVTLGKLDGFNGSVVVSAENEMEPFGPTLTGYRPVGDARLQLSRLRPLSAELPVVMQVEFPLNASGEIGFLNEGFWGMNVEPQLYRSSFYMLARGPFDAANLTAVNVSLRSNLTEDVWVTEQIDARDRISDLDYSQLQANFTPNITAPDSNNTFAVIFNGSEVAGMTFYFSLISLFPETYKDRPNGMRKDLAENIKALNPTFLRFPGGNNLEGLSPASRWQWNQTIGPLIHRPGRPGNWEYYNTDGFGLLEFLEWTEAMNIDRILDIYAGYSLAVSGEEIGNEDFFSGSYPRRFQYLYDGIKARYPNITFISSVLDENQDYTIAIPPGTLYDLHPYREPSFFLDSFNSFDNWQEENNLTDVNIFIGEYAVVQVDEPTGVINFTDPLPEAHVYYPQLLSILAESVYLLAMERNPSVVKYSAYAPSIARRDWFNWTPDMITFDANPNNTVLSASYRLQQTFANYRGQQSLQISNTVGDLNPLFWAASIDQTLNAVYLKLVNTLNTSVPLENNLDVRAQTVNGTIITNDEVNAYNSLDNQTAVVPRPIDLPRDALVDGTSFNWSVPAYSISVLQFDL